MPQYPSSIFVTLADFDEVTREKAEKIGIDLELLAENLTLSTEERFLKHQELLELGGVLAQTAVIHPDSTE